MTPHTSTTTDALDWYARGWRLFLHQPLMWVGLTLLFLIIALVINLVPLIGGLAFALCLPAFAAGFLHAADQAHKGNPVLPMHLFTAFQTRESLNALLLLGLIPLAASFAGAILIALLLGGAMGVGAITQSDDAAVGALVGGGLMLPLISIGLFVLVVAALIYAIPLVWFHQASAKDALMGSLEASARNILPLTLFTVIYVVLSLIAAMPAGLGFLVLIPVISGATYASYRQLWSDLVSADPDD